IGAPRVHDMSAEIGKGIKLNKTVVLALLVSAVAASCASAGVTRSFQLLDANNTQLCEHFDLTHKKDHTVVGVQNGCGSNDPVGGLYGGVRKVSNGGAWTIVLREPDLGGGDTQFVIVLNEKALTYTVFSQLDGEQAYGLLVSGNMLDV